MIYLKTIMNKGLYEHIFFDRNINSITKICTFNKTSRKYYTRHVELYATYIKNTLSECGIEEKFDYVCNQTEIVLPVDIDIVVYSKKDKLNIIDNIFLSKILNSI